MRQKRADKVEKVVRTDKSDSMTAKQPRRVFGSDDKPLQNQSLTTSGQVVRNVVRSCPEALPADNYPSLEGRLSGCPVSEGGLQVQGEKRVRAENIACVGRPNFLMDFNFGVASVFRGWIAAAVVVYGPGKSADIPGGRGRKFAEWRRVFLPVAAGGF